MSAGRISGYSRLRRAFVVAVLLAAAAPGALGAQPAPPPPPDPAIAVPEHVRRAGEHLASASVSDATGRRCIAEARLSLAAARTALARRAFPTADQLAASVDDFVRAASLRRPPDDAGAEQSLADADAMLEAVEGVAAGRVPALIGFTRAVEAEVRRASAIADPRAGAEGERVRAVARATVHVAIAAQPSLAPPPHPSPPHAPPPQKPPLPGDPPPAGRDEP